MFYGRKSYRIEYNDEDSLREAKEAAKRQYIADQAKSEAKEAAKQQYIADQAKSDSMEKQNKADQAKSEAIKNQYIADQAKSEATKNQYIADQAKAEAKEAAKRQYIADQAKTEAALAIATYENPSRDFTEEERAAMKNQYMKTGENPYVKPDETVVTSVLDTTPVYTPPVYTPPVYTPPVYTPPIILDEPFYVVHMTPLLILLVAIIVGIILFFVFKSKNRHSAHKFISAFGNLW